MEAPTLKEVVENLDWRPNEAESVGSPHYIQATYKWEDQEWTPTIQVLRDGQSFELELKQRTGRRQQSGTLEEAVRNCANAILVEIREHVRKHEAEQEQQRKLDEYNQKGQEWADKANSVSVEV